MFLIKLDIQNIMNNDFYIKTSDSLKMHDNDTKYKIHEMNQILYSIIQMLFLFGIIQSMN